MLPTNWATQTPINTGGKYFMFPLRFVLLNL
jgi:hypothetical protein